MPEAKRLFVAAVFDSSVKDILARHVTAAQQAGVTGRFSHRDNWHLTLVFIGETAEENKAVAAIKAVKAQPFTVTIGGFGVFSKPGNTILWAGVEDSLPLARLQRQLAEQLCRQGFVLRDTAYRPHITLGRGMAWPKGLNVEAQGRSMPRISARVNGICLMQSHRVEGRLVYTPCFEQKL